MTDTINRLIELAVQIQQIPAPTFAEGSRAEFVRSLFLQENLQDVSTDALGNVYARLAGISGIGNPAHIEPLVVSAHLDTVFPDGSELVARRAADKVFGAGMGDNALGVASLFGLIWLLRERETRLKGDVWLVADVGEEGLGDLCGMRGVVERFGAGVIGYLIVEGLALGHVYHRAVGVRRYRISVQTAGGHSWSDYGRPSAVHELAALITQLTKISLPHEPRTTLNVGTFHGGTGINVLASAAVCDLDLRSEHASVLTALVGQTEELIGNANREGVKVVAEVIGQRPAGEIPVAHPFVRLGLDALKEQGLEAVLTSGSTDANIPLSRGLPALVLGVTTGGGAHTTGEYIDVEPIEKGMEQLVRFVERAWD